MYYAHPTSGEHFYLCLLLSAISGATCWEDLHSYQGIRYPSFREACVACDLLEDDQEWHQCLNEARHMQTGYQLHHLFVTILYECTPSNPRALWETFCADICDDLRHFLITHTALADLSDAQVLDYGLYLIDQLLSYHGKSLQDWNTMLQVVGDWGAVMGNHLIQKQRQYNLEQQAVLAAECMAMLNPDQQAAFEKITSAITNNTGQLFFLHWPGGTGKTFLYNTLCYHLHLQQKIVLCVTSSGIAALLLKGGRTAHSAFKIPIPCYESSIYGFSKNSQLGELIHHTNLVIWDEAPMQHKHIMETVDRSFKDVCNSNNPFGGLTIIFGSDIQQILPVIIQGSRAQIVEACLQRSIL